MKFYFTAFLYTLTITCYSQQYEGVVIDIVTGRSIPYATVYIKNNPKNGCYSNEEGVFKISSSTDDSIGVSVIGYENFFFVPRLQHGNIIRMKPMAAILPEVVVSNIKHYKIVPLGLHLRKKEFISTGTVGGKIVLLIEADEIAKDAIISNIVYSIKKPIYHSKTKGKVRILLFDAKELDNDNLVNLLPEDKIFEVENKDYLLRINIEKYNIKIPLTGVYVGLEWLGEKSLDGTFKTNIAPNYYRSINTNSKTLDSFFGSSFYNPFDKDPNNKRYIPNFGVEVKAPLEIVSN